MAMREDVRPYDRDTGKKVQISRMFNRIAPYYDWLNRFLSLGVDQRWRRRAISLLGADRPRVVLDVATGTADMALETARRLRPERVVGIDISQRMLDIGRAKVKKRGLEQIVELLEGDSENLPFADDTFDAVTAAFGVRNFENLDAGLAEMRRVLKKDGRLIVLEFSRPRRFPFKQIFNSYFKYILPVIGRFTSKDPKAYRYLYESVQAFPDGDEFLNILENNGFNSNQCTALTLGICSVYSAKK
jgi:demethylmenaquinone methyltransferase/2-methoxy-6-polyprenyl-1,4-benzoquinol methylase